MKKVFAILSECPPFITANIVSYAFRQSGQLKQVFVHTGKYFDTSILRSGL